METKHSRLKDQDENIEQLGASSFTTFANMCNGIAIRQAHVMCVTDEKINELDVSRQNNEKRGSELNERIKELEKERSEIMHKYQSTQSRR